MAFPDYETLSSEELLHGQSQIWNHICNFINSMSLKCAIQLGIPEIIHKHGKPITMLELINALPIPKEKSNCVHRLMRILTHSMFFVNRTVGKDHCYWLTPSSRLLLKDDPLSLAPFALAMLDPLLMDPWHRVAEWFQNDDPTSFFTTHGKTFWDLAAHDPRMNQFFNEAMASDARLLTSVIVKDCNQTFEDLKSMVDVGGGVGTLAKAMIDSFPQLNCIVLDLPHVVAGLKGTDNLTFVGGDAFQYIPSADAVFLKWILHDWSDEECVKMLKKCKEAINSCKDDDKGAGKVIIVDMVLDSVKEEEALETQLCFDMLMMILVTGKERTEKDWAKLFSDAGFTTYKITPILGLRSLIELFP